MASLACIFRDQNELLEELLEGDGTLTPEMEARLSEIQISLPEKVDGYYLIMERLETEENYFNDQADKFLLASKVLGNARKRIKENLKNHLVNQNIETLAGNDFQFKLSKTKPSVVIGNEELIPKEYTKEIKTVQIDKERIRQDLSLGVPVPGASLVEGFSFRSSILKKQLKKEVKNEKK